MFCVAKPKSKDDASKKKDDAADKKKDDGAAKKKDDAAAKKKDDKPAKPDPKAKIYPDAAAECTNEYVANNANIDRIMKCSSFKPCFDDVEQKATIAAKSEKLKDPKWFDTLFKNSLCTNAYESCSKYAGKTSSVVNACIYTDFCEG